MQFSEMFALLQSKPLLQVFSLAEDRSCEKTATIQHRIAKRSVDIDVFRKEALMWMYCFLARILLGKRISIKNFERWKHFLQEVFMMKAYLARFFTDFYKNQALFFEFFLEVLADSCKILLQDIVSSSIKRHICPPEFIQISLFISKSIWENFRENREPQRKWAVCSGLVDLIWFCTQSAAKSWYFIHQKL